MTKLVSTLAALLIAAGVSLAGPNPAPRQPARGHIFTGEIFDSQCAMMGSHEKMEQMHHMANDSKACTLQCVKMGGKFVLYNAAKKRTYQLDDQEKPKEYAGQKVKVVGAYDTATKTIHVEKIDPAS